MTRWRRLVRDYERRIDVLQAVILVAMGANLTRRNASREFPNRPLGLDVSCGGSDHGEGGRGGFPVSSDNVSALSEPSPKMFDQMRC